jgi:hypothetical protein
MNGLSDLRTVGSQHMMNQLSTSYDDAHVAQVREIVRFNRRLTVRKITEECNMSIGSCHDILTTTLYMHRVVPKFVPKLRRQEQRNSRVAICQELLARANEDENVLKKIITCDKTWLYGYGVETKMQSS